MIDINRPRHEVAVYVTDPNWYANLERVTGQDDKRLTTGTRLDFVARFLSDLPGNRT